MKSEAPGADAALLSILRGRRRKLSDMALPDEESEYKLRGFRFCHWMERWRLALHVLSVPHGLQYTQLSDTGAPHCAPPTLTVTTPDDRVLTDKLEIYKCFSDAATTSAAWMSRLSDEDLLWHIARTDELGDAVVDMLQANTQKLYLEALARVQSVLKKLESTEDLSRFIRKYRKATDGTHFLDAFYAPLLLRIHIANRYYATAENSFPVINLEEQFPIVAIWTNKIVNWSLLLHVVLGEDFASSLLVYYRDRGSYLFNDMGPDKSLASNDRMFALHAKGLPVHFLRSFRLAIATRRVGQAVANSDALKRSAALCLCDAIVNSEQDALTRRCNVILRLKDYQAARESVPESDNWTSFQSKWISFVETTFGLPLKRHLIENFALYDLWLLEMDIMMALSRSEALQSFVLGFLEGTLQERVEFVQCLMQMVSLCVHVSSDGFAMEKALIDVLQCIYRESSPSDWADVAFRVSSVNGLVITKDNWHMHYKFPAVSMLSAVYNVVKGIVMDIHAQICPSAPSSGTGSADEREKVDNTSVEMLIQPEVLQGLMERLMAWVGVVGPAIRREYAPLIFQSDGEYQRHLKKTDVDEWDTRILAFQSNAKSLLDTLVAGGLADDRARKKWRVAWRKLKKDLVLLLRDQKKLLLPTLLRFSPGEQLEAAQLAFVETLAEQGASWDTALAELIRYASRQEVISLMNWLRFAKPALYSRAVTPANLQHEQDPSSFWSGLKPLSVCGDARHEWLSDPNNWVLHPKFAGVPFILGLSNRVLLDDVSACARAVKRALRGLGVLPVADVRARFEIMYAHYLSHREIIYKFVVTHLARDQEERIADLAAGDLEGRIAKLESEIVKAEASEEARRKCLEAAVEASETLVTEASRAMGALSSKYVPRCIMGFTYQESMELFAKIVNMYHRGNPHLLSRTVEALQEDEYHLFCRNMLSLPYALLKDVLDGLRSEISTRLWIRLVEAMPCLSGVTIDSPHWMLHPRFGGLPLFWQLSHRYIEDRLMRVLALIGDNKVLSLQSFTALLDGTQSLMQYVGKHGSFEDSFVLPRIASAVPFVAEANFDDTNNEHSLLEMNELRVIQILKASYKALKTEVSVPGKQVNRLKRQLRSYQTLILPHLAKEEEKFMPVMLHRFTPAQWTIMCIHLFDLYGDALTDEFMVDTLSLGTLFDQRLLLQYFLPLYVVRSTAPTYFLHHSVWEKFYVVSTLKDASQAATFIRTQAPQLWLLCIDAKLFGNVEEEGRSSPSITRSAKSTANH